ncbi:MAG: LuxR C-terminal-related transcriptional regulator [Microbacterium sp.]
MTTITTDIVDISSRRTSRSLYQYAALGYASLAVTAAREGHAPQARAALRAANELCASVPHESPSLAVQVHLSVARAALALGDGQEAHFALDQTQDLLCLVSDAGAVQCEIDDLRDVATQLSAEAPLGVSLLTPAEVRVLHLLTSHLTFEEIGRNLHVSRNTVKTHAVAVYRKLGVSSRSEAVCSARRLGLVAA